MPVYICVHIFCKFYLFFITIFFSDVNFEFREDLTFISVISSHYRCSVNGQFNANSRLSFALSFWIKNLPKRVQVYFSRVILLLKPSPIPRTELRQGICSLTIKINIMSPVLESEPVDIAE